MSSAKVPGSVNDHWSWQLHRLWQDLALPPASFRFNTYAEWDEWIAAHRPADPGQELHAVCDFRRRRQADTLCKALLAAARHRIARLHIGAALLGRPDLDDDPTSEQECSPDEVPAGNQPAPPQVDVITLVAAPSAPPSLLALTTS